MKKLLLLLFAATAGAQSTTILETQLTEISGGYNLHVKTVSFNGAGYIGSTQETDGSTLIVRMCFWYNVTLPVLTFENDVFIPASAPPQTIDLQIWNSADGQVCDYSVMSDQAMVQFLSAPQFGNPTAVMAPNPASAFVALPADTQSYSAFDTLGRHIETRNSTSLEVSQWPNGQYILRVKTPSGTSTQRLLVRH